MPKIAEFDPGNLALRPSETGVEATAGAARRIGMFYNQAAAAKEQTGHLISGALKDVGDAAVAIEGHREISTGSAKGVQVFSNLTDKKDQAIKSIDPNDPAYGQKVKAAVSQWQEQDVEPALQQFAQGFNTDKGQAWSEHFIEQTRAHMAREGIADTATAAAIGVRNSVHATVNEATNTALQNPSSVNSLIGLIEHSVGGIVDSSPISGVAGASVKADVSEKAKEQIVKAGAIGAIQKSSDPVATAAEWSQRYPQYINGQEAIALDNNARQQVKAREADTQGTRARATQQATDVSAKTADDYRGNVDSREPGPYQNQLAQQAQNDQRLTPKDKENVVRYVKRQGKPETPTAVSHNSTSEFYRELHNNPDADLGEMRQRVWDARGKEPGEKGSINQADFNGLLKTIEGRKTPEGTALAQDRGAFFKRYDSSIDGAMAAGGGHSALGKQRMYAAEQDAIRMEADLKRQGKDPHQLYNPSSPDFFGRPENLAKYSVSFQDTQKYDRDQASGKPPAATPEAPAAAPARAPGVGDVMRGYRFKGGDPSDRGNWEQVK